MSKCFECGREMNAAEASESMTCFWCGRGKAPWRIRTIHSKWSEAVGRKQRRGGRKTDKKKD